MKKKIGILILATGIFMGTMMSYADYETPRPKTIVEPEVLVETLLEDHQ